VAILTNGTLFHQPEVRKRVLQADVIISSFDAASETVFRKINRPHPALALREMVDGITALKEEFSNQLWMEVFIVPDLNDRQVELGRIQQVMDRIQPDQIQINSLDRPGTESWVKPVDREVLKTIQACMHNISMVDNVGGSRSATVFSGDLNGLIVSTIRRRPCTAADISEITGTNENKINQHLDILLKNGEVVTKQMPRGTFFFLKQQAKSMKPDFPV
jgi:wyosine [tRNA(Phe)-imidazoG37] synthetase (radical SAM superfamily)